MTKKTTATNKQLTKLNSWFAGLEQERKEKSWYWKLWFWYIKHYYYIIFGEIRSWGFRLKNGFDYRDTWSLDYNIAKYVYPRLKHLRDKKHGYPCGLTPKKWAKIMDKMLFAFEKILDPDYLYDKKTEKKIKEGLFLFGEYFQNLWD